MVDLFPKCPDPRRQPHRWQEGGLPLQARHQRRLQPPSGTLSPPTAIISDSAFEEWLHSDEMEVPMFSLLEGQRQQPPTRTAISTAEEPQQSAPTAVALAAAASGDRHACLPRCVVEGCGGSARIVSGRGIDGGTCGSAGDRRYCFPYCVGRGGGQGACFCRCSSGIDDGPGDQRYCSLRYISWGGTRIVSCSSGIGRHIGGGTGDQRYCSLGRIN